MKDGKIEQGRWDVRTETVPVLFQKMRIKLPILYKVSCIKCLVLPILYEIDKTDRVGKTAKIDQTNRIDQTGRIDQTDKIDKNRQN